MSLNEAMLKSLDVFNRRKLTGRKESRRELFEEVEKGYLQDLPAMRYQMKSRKSSTDSNLSPLITVMILRRAIPRSHRTIFREDGEAMRRTSMKSSRELPQ